MSIEQTKVCRCCGTTICALKGFTAEQIIRQPNGLDGYIGHQQLSYVLESLPIRSNIGASNETTLAVTGGLSGTAFDACAEVCLTSLLGQRYLIRPGALTRHYTSQQLYGSAAFTPDATNYSAGTVVEFTTIGSLPKLSLTYNTGVDSDGFPIENLYDNGTATIVRIGLGGPAWMLVRTVSRLGPGGTPFYAGQYDSSTTAARLGAVVSGFPFIGLTLSSNTQIHDSLAVLESGDETLPIAASDPIEPTFVDDGVNSHYTQDFYPLFGSGSPTLVATHRITSGELAGRDATGLNAGCFKCARAYRLKIQFPAYDGPDGEGGDGVAMDSVFVQACQRSGASPLGDDGILSTCDWRAKVVSRAQIDGTDAAAQTLYRLIRLGPQHWELQQGRPGPAS